MKENHTTGRQSATTGHRILAVLGGVLARLAAGVLVIVSYRAGVAWTMGRGPTEARTFVDQVVVTHLHPERVNSVAVLLVVLSLVRLVLDIRRQRPARTAIALVLPLLLVSVAFESHAVFASAFALTIAAFLLAEIDLARPLYQDDAMLASVRRWWIVFVTVLMVGLPIAVAVALKTVALLPFWLALYLVAYLGFGCRLRALVWGEGLILPLVIGLAMAGALALYTHSLDKAGLATLVLLGVALLHLVYFQRQAPRMRLFVTAMLTTVVVTVAFLEVGLDSKRLETRVVPPGGQVMTTPSKLEPPVAGARNSQGGRYLAVLGNGRFNDLPQGWLVEVGRIRGPRPTQQKPAGVFRIVALGSSSTEGCGVRNPADVWPAVLERQLNALGRPYRFEVINAGIGGTTTFGMLFNLRAEMIQYQPDLVLLYAANNDEVYAHGPLTERQMYELATQQPRGAVRDAGDAASPPYTSWWIAVQAQKMLARSTLYRLLRRDLLELRQTPTLQRVFALNKAPAVPPADFVDNLRSIARFCRERNVRLAWVGEAAQYSLARYKAIMATTAASENVPYVDANSGLTACTRDVPTLFQDEVHLTSLGNVCVAGIVRDLLLSHRMLPEALP